MLTGRGRGALPGRWWITSGLVRTRVECRLIDCMTLIGFLKGITFYSGSNVLVVSELSAFEWLFDSIAEAFHLSRFLKLVSD